MEGQEKAPAPFVVDTIITANEYPTQIDPNA